MPVNKISVITSNAKGNKIPLRRAHSFSNNSSLSSKYTLSALPLMHLSSINFKGMGETDKILPNQIIQKALNIKDEWEALKNNSELKEDLANKLEIISAASKKDEFIKHDKMKVIRPRKRNLQGRIIQEKKILGNLTKGREGIQYHDYDSNTVYTIKQNNGKTNFCVAQEPELSGITADCQPVIASYVRGFLLDEDFNIIRYDENYRGPKFSGSISNADKDCCSKTFEEKDGALIYTLSKIKMGIRELFEIYEIGTDKIRYTRSLNDSEPKSYCINQSL